MSAQKEVLVYMGNAVTLLSAPHEIISSLRTKYQAVRMVDDGIPLGAIY